jgi:hypothetical protein
LGIIDFMDYEQFDIELAAGDLVCVTPMRWLNLTAPTGRCSAEGIAAARGIDRYRSERDNSSRRCWIKSPRSIDGNLSDDDVTVMLLRPNAKRPRVRFRQKIGAGFRLMGAILKAFDPRAERPPLPDFKLPNIFGAVVPPLAKRWRPTSPLKTSRPSRQPIP